MLSSRAVVCSEGLRNAVVVGVSTCTNRHACWSPSAGAAPREVSGKYGEKG